MLKFYLLVLLILFYGIDCRAQQGKVGEQVRHFVEREHVGSVAFRYRRILVGFDEDAISPHCNAGSCYGFNHIGPAACYSRHLIGLLKRVGYIENHRTSVFCISGMPR